MAYTFGAATGDDINFSAQTAWVTSQRQHLVMGWYYPTTLTAGRVYFGNANTVGLRVGPTTSELRFVTDHTTDGVWDSSGAGIAVDTWWFIAVYFTGFNTGPTDDVDIWVGTVDTPPVPQSLTLSTSPSGNHVNNGVVAVGNQGSAGTVAFQGDISNWCHIEESGLNTYTQWALIANGTIDTNSAEQALRRYILPYWQQNEPECYFAKSFGGGTMGMNVALHGGNDPSVYRQGAASNSSVLVTTTANGVTFSDRRVPRPRVQPLFSQQFLRR